MSLLLKVSVPEVQQPGNGRGRKYAGEEFSWCGVPNLSYRLPHLGLTRICPRIPPVGRSDRYTKMGAKGEEQNISREITIPQRVSAPSIEHTKWECFPLVPFGL